MKFSQKWWLIIALLLGFSTTVSYYAAQTEEPSNVNGPNGSEVRAESNELQSGSDEPEQRQPTLASNTDTTLADAEIDRRFNELRRELLDDRAKTIDWWLAATAIFLTLLGVSAAILGYFGFKRLDRIEKEARENLGKSEKHAKEAQRHLEDIKISRAKAASLLKGINAEVAGANPDQASEAVENVQQNPDSSQIDRAVAAALSFQQQGEIEKAVEQWRALALVAEESDKDLAARAWFSVGYLHYNKDKPDFNKAIDAYDKVLCLVPDFAGAYINRGNVYVHLQKSEKAFADFNMAIDLKPTHAGAYFNRGNLYADLKEYDKAFADYKKAIDLKPDYFEAYLNRGITKRELKRTDEARQDFMMALSLARSKGNAEMLARARRNLEDFDKGNT